MAMDLIARAVAASAKNEAAQALSRSATLDLFTNLPARTLDAAVISLAAGGYSAAGAGGGLYVADAVATAALAAAHPRFCKASANGRHFRLVGDCVTVEQAGAMGDGGNDQPAIQAAIDYAIAVGIRKVKFTKSAYTLWTPVKGETWNGVKGNCIFIHDASIELEGTSGKTTLTQKGHLGGSIATETQTTTDLLTWRGSFIRVGGNGGAIPALTLRNLIFDGTIPYDLATGNSLADLSHKGIQCNNDELTNLFVHDCEMRGFRGEIFYLGGSKPDYCYVENLTLRDSAQCLWNAGSLTRVVAVNLDCDNSYQALEIISGKGHTYIGGRFANSSSSSIIGNQIFGGGFPYWYPQRDTAKLPTWLTFLGTRFEWFNVLPVASWTRGNIVCIDTSVYIGDSCDRDIDLNIEYWCDKNNGSAAVTMFGPSTATDQIPGAPAGTYYTKALGVHLRVNVRRTANAIANNRRADGIIFTGGLIDNDSCTFSVSGDVRNSWKVSAPVAGFKLPLVNIPEVVSSYSPLGGDSVAVTAGATTTMTVKAPCSILAPNAAGTSVVNISTTYGYTTGQRVIFYKWDNDVTRIIRVPANGTGLGLAQDRYLYRYGDCIELEFCHVANKWFEVRYQTSQQLTYTGSATYDPPNISTGTQVTTPVTVTGAVLGDYVDSISLGLDAAGLQLSGYVSAANTVTVVLKNDTGAAVNLASTTLSVEVRKKQ